MAKERTPETPETVDTQTSTGTPEKATNKKGRVLVNAAEFWDFEENRTFIGKFIDFQVGVDKETGEERILGYLMQEADTGEEWIIGASHGITKAFETEYEPGMSVVTEKDTVSIFFKGKITLGNGKPYNKFRVEIV